MPSKYLTEYQRKQRRDKKDLIKKKEQNRIEAIERAEKAERDEREKLLLEKQRLEKELLDKQRAQDNSNSPQVKDEKQIQKEITAKCNTKSHTSKEECTKDSNCYYTDSGYCTIDRKKIKQEPRNGDMRPAGAFGAKPKDDKDEDLF